MRDGVTIRVATYALKNERAVKQLTDLSATIIKFYQEFLGPFPFPEFNIIEIDSYGFGQAPPGVMFITKEAFNPLGEPRRTSSTPAESTSASPTRSRTSTGATSSRCRATRSNG